MSFQDVLFALLRSAEFLTGLGVAISGIFMGWFGFVTPGGVNLLFLVVGVVFLLLGGALAVFSLTGILKRLRQEFGKDE